MKDPVQTAVKDNLSELSLSNRMAALSVMKDAAKVENLTFVKPPLLKQKGMKNIFAFKKVNFLI